MWQKCPICNGTGENPNLEKNKNSCPVCKGGLIINENGDPPKAYIAKLKVDQAINVAEKVIEIYKSIYKNK